MTTCESLSDVIQRAHFFFGLGENINSDFYYRMKLNKMTPAAFTSPAAWSQASKYLARKVMRLQNQNPFVMQDGDKEDADFSILPYDEDEFDELKGGHTVPVANYLNAQVSML